MNSVAIGLGYVGYSQEICEDSAVQLDLFTDKDMKVVAVSGASTTSPEVTTKLILGAAS
jgi:1-aminocyclopropane-1-carboxylate deaminase/D-cysteine desulfhydrase-like pyridoxal-dependent ACC family enzyme